MCAPWAAFVSTVFDYNEEDDQASIETVPEVLHINEQGRKQQQKRGRSLKDPFSDDPLKKLKDRVLQVSNNVVEALKAYTHGPLHTNHDNDRLKYASMDVLKAKYKLARVELELANKELYETASLLLYHNSNGTSIPTFLIMECEGIVGQRPDHVWGPGKQADKKGELVMPDELLSKIKFILKDEDPPSSTASTLEHPSDDQICESSSSGIPKECTQETTACNIDAGLGYGSQYSVDMYIYE